MRVSEEIGRLILVDLAQHGHRDSPVIMDPWSPDPRMYFLLPAGSVTGPTFGPGTIALGRGSHVVVPPFHSTEGPGLHWHRPPTGAHLFIDAVRFREALERVTGVGSEGE
ncbi:MULTISPECIES: hypothetical protein [unclassified Streptomyces]|uniref:hypothetical protein n=1 Tax=unclassified Streptomyces TaxID=2593676 RepID=UPI00136F667B|nr:MULTISPECIES: hypothetical protein [unclassified Streptomyces]NEA05225.1 hypothetical protein [Streptomyces sp. SID10116]NEB45402.1 hypothetical protein [Streptomyces sp. SID339]